MVLTDVPVAYSSVHGDLIYCVFDPHSNDSTTYPNYKYIADIYVSGTLVARVRKAQNPVTGHGVFNISEIVRNYLVTTFNPSPTALVSQSLITGQFFVPVIINFGEEYSYTSYYDVLIDDERTFFNSYDGRLTGLANVLTPKINKLVTNNPLSGKVLLTSSFYLVNYFPTTTASVTVTVTPTGGGSSFSTSFTPGNAYELQVLNIAPVALNALHAGAITSNTTSYTVQVGSQIYTVYLTCEAMYQTYMIHFLNQYGGFESILFTKVSRTKYKVDRKDFGKLNYTVSNSGIISYKNTNGVYNEGLSTYAAQYEERLTLNSDLLTDAEYTWLRDLILSPMVYIQDGAYFFPVTIEDNDYEPKKAINDDLTNLTITIKYGQNLNSQFR
jgi:hypothetical protein